ncbi:MAG: flagellar basal body-associated FliL family protein [Deltaproteobacteria bacterium]|nr:flagellar basal body-associated FliL family protein [Deltaproteobacteria bacterium]
MATAAESVDGVEVAAPESKKSKKSLLLLLLLLLLLVVVGAGAAAWFLGLIPHGQAGEAAPEHAAPEAAAASDHGAKPTHGPDVGPMRALEPFVANLADRESRYLKITLQVEFAASEPPAFDARMPQVRDVILTLITSKTFADIRTPEGKERMREEVIDRINHVVGQSTVKSIYFTDFIVQ